MDPKLLEKPTNLARDPHRWREWRLRFESYFDATDDRFGQALSDASRVPASIASATVPIGVYQTLGRFLYALLLGLLGGALLELVSPTPSHNGREAWRTIVHEMESLAANRSSTSCRQ